MPEQHLSKYLLFSWINIHDEEAYKEMPKAVVIFSICRTVRELKAACHILYVRLLL